MRRGFTIIELLVASLLLGMLVTVLTMIFNQSSIAWRIGIAGVAELDEVRDNVAEVRVEADSVYLWNDNLYRLLSPWDKNGVLRTRAIDISGVSAEAWERAGYLQGSLSGLRDDSTVGDLNTISVGSGNTGRVHNYIVNVMSAGPDREFDTWDDIWSYPDDIE